MISLPLPPSVVEDFSSPSRFSATVERVIEETWQLEQARRPSLFNGKIFTVTEIRETQVVGRFVEYKLFLAQLRRPELFDDLKIEIMAVTGILSAESGIVWGRREANSSQHPGTWELLPSGGLDNKARRADGALDIQQQLLNELEEELGLKEKNIEQIRPICFVHDVGSHLYNFVTELRTSLTMEQIIRLQSALPRREHSELQLVPPHRLKEFISDLPPDFAEFSNTILSHGSFGSYLRT